MDHPAWEEARVVARWLEADAPLDRVLCNHQQGEARVADAPLDRVRIIEEGITNY